MAGILKMGTVQLESSDGLKVASLTHGTDDILGFDKRLKVQGAEVGNPILAEYTVTGSAVTSIDFSGLDINAHGGSYEVELRIVNAVASQSSISCYMNNDTTATNYYSQYRYDNGATSGLGRNNNAVISVMSSSLQVNTNMLIQTHPSGYPTCKSMTVSDRAVSILNYDYSLSKTATVTNITQLTFTASVASSIGIGSKIIIRRKDK